MLPPIDVRVTQVNRERLRLLQALVPIAGLLAALARGFDSLLALALLAILADYWMEPLMCVSGGGDVAWPP